MQHYARLQNQQSHRYASNVSVQGLLTWPGNASCQEVYVVVRSSVADIIQSNTPKIFISQWVALTNNSSQSRRIYGFFFVIDERHFDILIVVVSQDFAASTSISLTAYPRTKHCVVIEFITSIGNRFRLATRRHHIKMVCVYFILIFVGVHVQCKWCILQATASKQGTWTQRHRLWHRK